MVILRDRTTKEGYEGSGVGGSWTLTNPIIGSQTQFILGNEVTLTGVMASSTQLTLPATMTQGTVNTLHFGSNAPDTLQLAYSRENIRGIYWNEYWAENTDMAPTAEFSVEDHVAPGLSAMLGGADPWVIAVAGNGAVSEPSTFVSFAAGALSLAGCTWRRRK